MRSISQLIQIIRTARYGRDMRTAIADGLEVIAGGGAGNTSSSDMTLSEYTDLSSEEKMNGTCYYITDKNYVMRNGVLYGSSIRLLEITESEYAALVTKDASTLYLIKPDPEVTP